LLGPVEGASNTHHSVSMFDGSTTDLKNAPHPQMILHAMPTSHQISTNPAVPQRNSTSALSVHQQKQL